MSRTISRRITRRALLRAAAGGAALLTVGAVGAGRAAARETQSIDLVEGWNAARLVRARHADRRSARRPRGACSVELGGD